MSNNFEGSSVNDENHGRASSTDPSAAFKPQPSPRVVRSSLANWRSPAASSTTTSTTSGPLNGIMSGASSSSVTSSTYQGIKNDHRNTSGTHPQKVNFFIKIIKMCTLSCLWNAYDHIIQHFFYTSVFLCIIWGCSDVNYSCCGVSFSDSRTAKRARTGANRNL